MRPLVKVCFKCDEEKPIEEFYKNAGMADGRVNKCKECNKKDVSENYADKREQYAEYERKRYQKPERRKAVTETNRKMKANNPEKYKTHSKVAYAIKSGKLIKQPCEVCGVKKAQAHHDDYSKTLDVRWLCRKHHLEVHGKVAYKEVT